MEASHKLHIYLEHLHFGGMEIASLLVLHSSFSIVFSVKELIFHGSEKEEML